MGALAAHGQAAAVAQAAVAADVHQHLDVLARLAAQVALDAVIVLDHLAQPHELAVGEPIGLGLGRNFRLLADLRGARVTDAGDVGERDLDPLVARKIDAGDACHVSLLPLSLLVLGIRADDPHDPAAPDDAALVTDLLDRRSDLHRY